MKCRGGGGVRSISAISPCSSGAVAAESQRATAEVWERASRGGEVRELEQRAARNVSCNKGLSRKKKKRAVITLKDKYEAWLWENAGEFILEGCNEKRLL